MKAPVKMDAFEWFARTIRELVSNPPPVAPSGWTVTAHPDRWRALLAAMEPTPAPGLREAVGPRITPVERLVDVARRLAGGAQNRLVWDDLDAALTTYDAAKKGTPDADVERLRALLFDSDSVAWQDAAGLQEAQALFASLLGGTSPAQAGAQREFHDAVGMTVGKESADKVAVAMDCIGTLMQESVAQSYGMLQKNMDLFERLVPRPTPDLHAQLDALDLAYTHRDSDEIPREARSPHFAAVVSDVYGAGQRDERHYKANGMERMENYARGRWHGAQEIYRRLVGGKVPVMVLASTVGAVLSELAQQHGDKVDVLWQAAGRLGTSLTMSQTAKEPREPAAHRGAREDDAPCACGTAECGGTCRG